MPDRWAILIGINGYATKPLRGCVNDVNLMKAYLEASSSPVKVTALTATPATDPGSSPLQEEHDLWPTLSNLRRCVDQILALAVPGNFVYIHFSGHGTRFPRPPRLKYGKKSGGDVGLLFLNDSATACDELRGLALANTLKRITDHGLVVTLTLDCCFSGDVYRQHEHADGSIRSMEHESAFDIPDDPEVNGSGESRQHYGLRDARALPNWLVKPEGYLVITACGPHEVAGEVTLNGLSYGVLSYHLHDILTSLLARASQVSVQTIYNALVSMVHQRMAKQTPMLYGSNGAFFFGEVLHGGHVTSISATYSNQQLVLEAGHAHGVNLCDEYILSPFWAGETVNGSVQEETIRARVMFVGQITSIVELLDISMSTATASHWKAQLVSRQASTLVGLMRSISRPSDLVTALQELPSICVSDSPRTSADRCGFYIQFDMNRGYELLDADQKALPLPPIQQWDPLIKAVDHIAAFSYYKAIEPPSHDSDFHSLFEISMRNEQNTKYNMEGVVDVVDQEELTLTVKNLSQTVTLYVTVLNFTPSWQIQYLSGEEGGTCFDAVSPADPALHFTGTTEMAFAMAVPEHLRSSGCCDDIIRIIVTNTPTSFDSLLLPKLSSILQQTTRGGSQGLDSTKSIKAVPQNLRQCEEKAAVFTVTIRTYV
ncbi:putative caspase [Aspergillus fischeri NRRL 181]|uniref:Caspase, putative n=1 Tax=Neosartorya fischeri (strain ATCC 1020 / DSM 3700 / CBS 544.65 / FGSC A1164 / JCM 1740 / NRRL 181 / WB 181) TaxID=331117 RepID=A1DKK0_NEOFI|nr:caspase, putative [Aspergillus fischeri NRRL 181]EAW17239.1 caspase, putative [Aspergillus fischeri NRRL 181]